MLLVRAGLTEDETDAFLEHLRADFAAGRITNDSERMAAIERALAAIETTVKTREGSLVATWKAIYAIVLGAAGSALWEFLKAEWSSKTAPPREDTFDQKFPDEILVEWIGQPVNPVKSKSEPLFQRALQLRRHRLGPHHHHTAVSLDALGMCLSDQGRNREATALRQQVVRIEEKLVGLHHFNTGAAYSNLGICLAAQGRLEAGERCLRQGLKIILKQRGQRHIATAAAAHNELFVLKRLGRVPSGSWTPPLFKAERELREAGNLMMTHKFILTTVDASQELLVHIKKEIGLR